MSTHRNGPLQGFAATVLRIALGVAGFVLALGALFIGLVLSAGLIVWALIRHRKPVAQLFRERAAMARGFRAAAPVWRQSPRGEVVDVAVREVPAHEVRRV